MKVRSIVLLLMLTGALVAQTWTVELNRPPSDKFFFEQLWSCRITNTEEKSVDVKLYGWIERGDKEIGHGRSNKITIPPRGKLITAADIKSVKDEWYDREYERIAKRRGALPAGVYKICVQVEFMNKAQLIDCMAKEPKDCRMHEVKSVSPPKLISPRDGATIEEEFPTFIWTPPVPAVESVTYFRIAEIPEGITPKEAMERPMPFFEKKGIRKTTFKYPSSARKLEKGKRYVWQVTAFRDGREVGQSEAWKFKYGKEGCECGEWGNLNVSWDTESQSVLPCGAIEQTVFVTPGLDVTVSGVYLCDPNDPNTCPVTYQWEWTEFDQYTIYNSGNSGSQVDECNFNLVFAEGHCCTVYVTSFCNGELCDQCVFKVCTDTTDICECGEWDSLTVEVNGISYDIDCPNDTINLGEIQYGTVITADPNYSCEPYDPDLCSVTYIGTVIPPGGSATPVTTLDYSLTETGCYQFEITPICGGDTCDTCSFTVCDTIITDSCECGKWRNLNVTWDGESQSVLPCEQETVFVDIGTEVTISGEYSCNPQSDCEDADNYEWRVIGPTPGTPVVYSSGEPTCDFSFMVVEEGCYTVEVYPYCDGELCGKCVFKVCTDTTDLCECGEWSNLNVTWDGESQSMLPCGQETVFVDIGTEVTMSGVYFCDPAKSCPVTYDWYVTGPTIGPAGGSEPTCDFNFTVAEGGCYTVKIYSQCGGELCDTCVFKVCAGETECECGEWGASFHGVQDNVKVTHVHEPPPGVGVYGKVGVSLHGCGDIVTMGPLPGTGYTESVTLNSVISCVPAGCEPTYTYDVIKPDGSFLYNNETGHSVHLEYDPQEPGTYTVVLHATCDGVECPPCTMYVEFEGSGCPDPMMVPSNVNNTSLCDGGPALEVLQSNQPSQWSDGLENSPCNGKWLWDDASGHPDPNGESHEFCTTFEIPEGCEVEEAKLYISVDNEAAISLNSWTGSASVYDGTTIIPIPANYLIAGQNTLKVKVTDDDDWTGPADYAGGIWCLYIYFQ